MSRATTGRWKEISVSYIAIRATRSGGVNMPLALTSGQSGSLWVTYHTDRKIKGSESVMSMCRSKCAFSTFCYSEHLQSFMEGTKHRGELNCVALEQSPDTFETPEFSADIVRWFSYGSCNGDRNTLINVKDSVMDNPEQTHGVWVEPHYWITANEILGDTPINIVFSNKKLDTVVQSKGHVSFNLATTEETLQRLHHDYPETIICSKNCGKCGWQCYHLDEGMVIEKINRNHGKVPTGEGDEN